MTGVAGSAVRFGLHIFPTDYTIRIDELAVAAEAVGFESLFVPEHTHIPLSRRSAWPGGGELPREYGCLLDPFVALGAAAAVTSRLRIGTGICLVVERDPIVLAKEVATLDVLSRGRFIFGVGGGWNAEEMADHGTDFALRWQVLRERVAAMKEIWTSEAPRFHGRFVNFDRCLANPKPVQRPHPPILVGGMGGHARQRAVDCGAGWMPIHGREDIVAGIEDLRQRAERAGRGPVPVTVWSAKPDAGVVGAYVKAGVHRIVLTMPPLGRDAALGVLDSYAAFIKVFA